MPALAFLTFHNIVCGPEPNVCNAHYAHERVEKTRKEEIPNRINHGSAYGTDAMM